MSSRFKAFTYLFLAALIWGFAAIVIKHTLLGVPPFLFLLYRFGIASGVSIPMLSHSRKTLNIKASNAILIILYALFSTTISLSLLFIGLTKTSVLVLSLVSLASPLLLIAASVIFLKERVTKHEKIGITLAFFGTLLTIIEPLLLSNGHAGELTGNIFILLSVTTDAISILILKKLMHRNVSPKDLTNISFLVGFITLLPIILLMYDAKALVTTFVSIKPEYMAGIIYMALFSGTLAYFFRAKGQKTVKVSEASLFGYLQSVFTVIFAIAFLHESFTLAFAVGASIIATGIFIAESHRHKT